MKILLDINLTPKWRPFLEELGCEVKHWSEIGNTSAPDTELMAWAKSNGYLVFTNDLDYGALLHWTGAPGPSVIQARDNDVRPAALLPVMAKVLTEAREELLSGALVTVDARRYRISILPLRRSV